MIQRTKEPGTTGRTESTGRDGSAVDLLKDLRDDATRLVRAEVELAKAEVKEQIRSAGRGAGAVATGGLVAYAGLLFALAGASWGLTLILEAIGLSAATSLWLGPLIVGVVVGLIGWGMLGAGMKKLRNLTAPAPETRESIREDKEWAKEKVKR